MHRFSHCPIKTLTVIAICALGTISCGSTPVKTPMNTRITVLDDNAINIDRLTPKTIKVAADKGWQSSGIFLSNGEHIKVKATGKWSPSPILLQWSGGEGSTFWATEVDNITGGALMAKLGHDGDAFEIGLNRNFQANDYGMLYFAMNDPFKWQFDNSGELDVAIYSDTGTSTGNGKTTPATATEVIAYNYNDKTGKGSLSARISGGHFKTRNWMIKKIGEISSSKRVALNAGKESLQGGNYQVLDESTRNGVLTIHFQTLY